MKRCCTCKRVKPLEEFNRCRAQPDGLQGFCRPCGLEHTRRWREQNREKARESQRRSAAKHRDTYLRTTARWVQRNPGARSAHKKVHYAVSTGKLVRPDDCERCGRDDLRIHAHHADYSQPLDVEWLCGRCHREVHDERAAA